MKILLIATQLPPYIGSGNIRALNYINHLQKLGNDIDIIGVDYPKDSIAYDDLLENSFNDKVNIYRIKPGSFYRLFYRKKDTRDRIIKKEEVSFKSKLRSKINKFIRYNLLIPDSYVLWITPAYKIAKKLIFKGNYDLVISMHETPSSHLVAYKIKRKFPNLRWIGYWSDPWNGDSADRINHSWLKRKIEEGLEKRVIGRVDKLLFTTRGTKKYYEEKYKITNKKTEIVYRGYDQEKYCEIKSKRIIPVQYDKKKVNLVHVGTIYKKLRDIDPLCEALNLIKINEPDMYKNLNIIFLGQFDDNSDQEKLGRFECIQVIPFVPYEEALSFMVHADILLLYGNKNSTQVPGKAYEYLGSHAAILTILGNQKDELRYLMEKANKGPILLNESNNIYKELVNLYFRRIKGELPKQWSEQLKTFQWDNIGKDLESKLKIY